MNESRGNLNYDWKMSIYITVRLSIVAKFIYAENNVQATLNPEGVTFMHQIYLAGFTFQKYICAACPTASHWLQAVGCFLCERSPDIVFDF